MAKKSKPAKKKKKSSKPEDDEALWAHVTDDVTPISDRRIPGVWPGGDSPAKLKPETATTNKTKASRNVAKPQRAMPAKASRALPALDHHTNPGIDKRTAMKFKRGKMPIEGRLDLHGKTQIQAHRSLDGFINRAYNAQKRCLLVITGKGLGPDGSVGILRANVPHWLNQPNLRDKVLSFTYAQRSDGGEGALYVLLKRQRD